MAVEKHSNAKIFTPCMEEDLSALLSSYLGLSFSVFLAFLPRSSLSHVFSLQSRNRILSLKLLHAEEQLRQMRFRRKEDSKANARVVEIFATHRNAWQQEEKRLLNQIDASAEEIAALRSKIDEIERLEAELQCSVKKLQRELTLRDQMLDFMSRRVVLRDEKQGAIMKNDIEQLLSHEDQDDHDYGEACSQMERIRAQLGIDLVSDACFVDRREDLEEMALMYCRENGFDSDSLPSSETSKRWMESPKGGWQDIQYDSRESTYLVKPLVARRDYPWNISSDAAGVSSKLKSLDQDFSNLEKVEKGELSKAPLLLRKQAKRYQSLAGKIDDLCRKMQLSEACESSLSPDFRAQRQTEFLVEAVRLQHRAKDTKQKLNAVLSETAANHLGSELMGQARLATRRSLDSIRSNLKEVQRNLEIWMARIMGDLEGILATDGSSRVRDYYLSQHPFVR